MVVSVISMSMFIIILQNWKNYATSTAIFPQQNAAANAQGGDAASDKSTNQRPPSSKPANQSAVATLPAANERLADTPAAAPAAAAAQTGGAHYVPLTGDVEKDKKIKNLSKVSDRHPIHT